MLDDNRLGGKQVARSKKNVGMYWHVSTIIRTRMDRHILFSSYKLLQCSHKARTAPIAHNRVLMYTFFADEDGGIKTRRLVLDIVHELAVSPYMPRIMRIW